MGCILPIGFNRFRGVFGTMCPVKRTGGVGTMNKDVNPIGLVGARGFELQAWQSPGANALEDAYWATRVPPVQSRKSRLMCFVEGISTAAMVLVTPK
jgi:hypothetical protein